MTWHPHNTVSSPAGQIAWGCAGSGPPLVLAHGWPWSSYSWHRVIPSLARSFHVHWYDMPGYGRSAMHEAHATGLDIQGEIFALLLSEWNLERPHVLAHDFGGAATLRAHLLHECDYASYLLMNVVAMRPWGSDVFDHMKRHRNAFSILPQHIHEAIVRAYIGGALARDLITEDIEALVAPWLSDAGRVSFYRQFAQADERFTAEIEPMFGSLRCPALILWGEEDPWIPLERGQALAAAMPKAGFKTLPEAGHLPQLEVPEKVLETALSFFDRSSASV
ncbi:MAG: alpha/beta hydrolase [Pseudomonadota bacterium]